MESIPGAPSSPLFQIRKTPHSGRAVFAARFIPADTLVWTADDLTLSVLLRDYRREVCGQCFAYEHGRELKVRDQAVGFSFCSEACQQKWRVENKEVGVEAWTAVEALVKKRSKEDVDMVDVNLPRPTESEIKEAVESAKVQGELIRDLRQKEFRGTGDDGTQIITKKHKKALQKALLLRISPDVMSFYVSSLIWWHNADLHWEPILNLTRDKTPYHNADDLEAFTRTYLQLLAIMPEPLIPLVGPKPLTIFASHDSHNSFGIRSLEDDGSEFFGYGCWPSASYFNHSCAPNLEKKREGRVWYFRTARDVEAGEELCITYLSGEERKLSRGKRMVILKRNWGFECACERCEEV